MTFHIVTLFPEVFEDYLKESIIGKAVKKGHIKVKFYDIRKFSKDKKHHKVDDKAYGGGPGMVLEVEPILKAVNEAIKGKKQVKIILFSAGGGQFDSKMSKDLSKHKDIVMIAGRYEGVDERIKKVLSDNGRKVEEISIGPYVLTGGEIPAMVLIDAVSRQIKGVLGKNESLEEERYGVGVPVYTRPEVFKYKSKAYKVPKELISGNHKVIAAWRKANRRASPSNNKNKE